MNLNNKLIPSVGDVINNMGSKSVVINITENNIIAKNYKPGPFNFPENFEFDEVEFDRELKTSRKTMLKLIDSNIKNENANLDSPSKVFKNIFKKELSFYENGI